MGEPLTVYVALRNEGTSVWRPVAAELAGRGLYRLIGPIPQGEAWEFQPGEVVRCQERSFAGSVRALVAVECVAIDPN
jgi:hypothetical protein